MMDVPPFVACRGISKYLVYTTRLKSPHPFAFSSTGVVDEQNRLESIKSYKTYAHGKAKVSIKSLNFKDTLRKIFLEHASYGHV